MLVYNGRYVHRNKNGPRRKGVHGFHFLKIISGVFQMSITQEFKIMKENSHIDKNTFDYLKPDKPKVGRFYLLPKIHKVNNPGRPIVSANGHPTEKNLRIRQFPPSTSCRSVTLTFERHHWLSSKNGIHVKCKIVMLQYQCEQLDKTFRWWFFNDSLVLGLSTCFDTVQFPPSTSCRSVNLTFERHHWLSSKNGIHEHPSFGDHSCFDGRYV
jgi:hypothetical protein